MPVPRVDSTGASERRTTFWPTLNLEWVIVQPAFCAVSRRRIPLVGPASLTYRDYLCALRAGMGLEPAPVLGVPAGLMRASAWMGERVPGAVLTRENLAMLERGNTADAVMTKTLLGRAPRHIHRATGGDAARPRGAAGLAPDR
jgi:hypothetical protein